MPIRSATKNVPGYYFDPADYSLVEIVNKGVEKTRARDGVTTEGWFQNDLHPNGIKQLSVSAELRMANAIINLLGSLESGLTNERLDALRLLRDEAMNGESHFRHNTGRVLIQIMKDLVRAYGDTLTQLKLAHDFRAAATGKRRIVRAMLSRYHLLEMPEEWNQIAFDHHVHDANSKGRKSPTHLIMDAWVKGIRKLTVIYYNYINNQTARELLYAAKIMGVTVRIGVEYHAWHKDRYVKLIWAPRGFQDAEDFLTFLQKEDIAAFMNKGREISSFVEQKVLHRLHLYNTGCRKQCEKTLGISLPELSVKDFKAFIGKAQASLPYLKSFIHSSIEEAITTEIDSLQTRCQQGEQEPCELIEEHKEHLNSFSVDSLIELQSCFCSDGFFPSPDEKSPDTPELLGIEVKQLLDSLRALRSGCRITLNLASLTAYDVLSILYAARGRITHLEIYNLRNTLKGDTNHLEEISKLQQAINSGNIVPLKRQIYTLMHDGEEAPCTCERCCELKAILAELSTVQKWYSVTALRSHIGSDSSGSSSLIHGMGFVVARTLPPRARRSLRASINEHRRYIPIEAILDKTIEYMNISAGSESLLNRVAALLRGKNGETDGKTHWKLRSDTMRAGEAQQIATLGGITYRGTARANKKTPRKPKPNQLSFTYLNTNAKNALKIAAGFVPAFLSFYLSQDWWFLAWFGALIWFCITGFRNILQMVLGGGGISRTPLLHWNDYVRWGQLADSLLYTGISVPLLDFFVKTLLLEQGFGVTNATNPVLQYAVIALINGVYIHSHNAFRGFPTSVIIGNYFRSILSIPLALCFNWIIGGMLDLAGVASVSMILQQWAAVTSKAASDCVAAIVEGGGDRKSNLAMRAHDYKAKLRQLFHVYARLETLFPDRNMLNLLNSPDTLLPLVEEKAPKYKKALIIHALDMMHIFMYQPRAKKMLEMLCKDMSEDEKAVVWRSQLVLEREKEISQLLVDGLVGTKFSRPLAFYLSQSKNYLQYMDNLFNRKA